MGFMRTYKLGCGHGRASALPAKQFMWCMTCKKNMPVVPEWHIRCRDCRYGQSFGAAELNAKRTADKHQRKHGHRMYVMYPGKVVETRKSHPRQGTISELDAPPF